MKPRISKGLMYASLTAFAVCVLVLCGAGKTDAAAAYQSGYYYYTVSGSQATITDCSTSISGYATLPSSINGYTVTRIGDEAFKGCTYLTGVTIPKTVTNIGSDAFNNCSSLRSVSIPEGVTNIGSYAFFNCASLEGVTIPDSVTALGDYTFSGCVSLSQVKIGKGITSIGYYVFKKCGSIPSVTIPDGIRKIDYGAFTECTGLTRIDLPDSVTLIGARAFEKCSSLKTMTIPRSVVTIGDNAFNECSALQNVYYFGSYSDWQTVNVGYNNDPLFRAVLYHASHSYSQRSAKAATCTAKGERTLECPCGKVTTETIPALGHQAGTTWKVIKKPTCTQAGQQAKYCVRCGARTNLATIKATGHTLKTAVTKATTSKDGKTVRSCSVCKATVSTAVIPRVKTVTLSATKYTYDKKTKTPSVTVKDSKGKTLKNGTDYSVTYASGRKYPGTYKVTVTLKGNYSGSKTLSYKIEVKQVTGIKQIRQKGYKLAIQWDSVPQAVGYEVQRYDSKSKKWKTVGTATGVKIGYRSISGSFSWRVRAKVTVGKKTYYGAYSKTLKTKS